MQVHTLYRDWSNPVSERGFNMKRTFEEWLKIIYNMTMEDFYKLNEYQQTALRLEYRGW